VSFTGNLTHQKACILRRNSVTALSFISLTTVTEDAVNWTWVVSAVRA